MKYLVPFILVAFIHSTIINIPGDYPSIQQGINASVNGDTVLVQPGIYYENINFNGHNITLTSMFIMDADTSHISQTIIDGNQNGSVVIFNNFEGNSSILQGLTITNGLNNNGAGIYFESSSPTFIDLVVTENTAVDNGGGIYGYGSNGLIYPNFTNVSITDNTSSYGGGGGIYFQSNTIASMDNVTITGNSASTLGGGIYAANSSIQNINSILWSNSPNEVCLSGNNNTFLNSHSDIQNGLSGIINHEYNIVQWLSGNIDHDPLFMFPDTSNYTLQPDSPCIDAGATLVVFDQDTLYQADPSSFIGAAPDMGAFEFDINSQYILGDINQDFQINVLDIVSLVGIILGEIEENEYNLWAGDINEDSNLDVLDIVFLVNLILGSQ